ncbi:L-aspartate oxidase [Mameliella sp. AT18]|uniref:L-aspartate oxidase n=1 Tax=Mameliella sp. AT18 TaxID=3028385 RepID=UPI0008410250|nr:L-aspartate oxidase [Mameliella sp. AT18]MDD9731478.1 L-aspartate oxidase [Mameliella sp. AT18]ODM47933.1 L-aspartate oxidase [Ruegeria sp. PBVC088]
MIRLGQDGDRVTVVGGGIAGMICALELAPQPVVLITRAGLGQESSSQLAQGGIAACLGTDDSVALHLADTLAAGAGLCDPEVAETVLSGAPGAIAALEAHGVRFDRTPEGDFARGLEAAHSRKRILHVDGDGTGAGITRALSEAVRRCPSISVLTGAEVVRLVRRDGPMRGVLLNDGRLLSTSRVVMATGGLGGLYDASTNPVGNYGQGVMLAARAGAQLSDMEFVQFHPTALDTQGTPLGLISEAVRGEGAVLINAEGTRFMADTPGAELAPRDVVARAIAAQIARGSRVFLDARPALGAGFAKRFPGIARLCQAVGIDPAQQPIPVRPAAHYHMGGIHTDTHARTSLSGLWAIGECAATGLHGANRLASNSLLEAVVMGQRAAQDIAGQPAARPRGASLSPVSLPPVANSAAVRRTVSENLGLLRDDKSLRAALAALLPLAQGTGASADPAIIGLAIATFALLREESRGAHARTDYPDPLPGSTSCRMTLDDIMAVAEQQTTHPLPRSA